jgi:DNA polymerase III delta prime subunit
MHAFIIDGGTEESRASFIQQKLYSHTELIHTEAEKTSITIKQIQDLRAPLSISTHLPRLVWIEEANLMTTPAQNALLKLLEEPPANTSFYLTCSSASMLLPTIRSRALHESLGSFVSTSDPKVPSDLKNIMQLSAGDRLSKLGKMDRSTAMSYLVSIETALREKLASELPDKSLLTLAKIAKLAQIAHRQLSENCSVSLVLQTFYLKLPHTHPVK